MLNKSTKLAWEVFCEPLIAPLSRCCFFTVGPSASLMPLYMPRISPVLAHVLPSHWGPASTARRPGVGDASRHSWPYDSERWSDGVDSILEITEKGSTLVSKGQEQSSRAYKEPIRLFPSTKAEDPDAASVMEPLSSAQVFSGGSVVNSEVKALHTRTESCHIFMFPHQLSV